ncbi:MAG: hypothetical protein FJW96_13800, partial [Actinobacteria bacterium]|nr:hypothetical protein [Actinomycetota bacterium]
VTLLAGPAGWERTVIGVPEALRMIGPGSAARLVAVIDSGDGVGGDNVCPSCQILAVRVGDDDGASLADDIVTAIDFAVARGASVISLSLGSPDPGNDPYADAIARAVAAGVVVVAGAGNDGAWTPFLPAATPGAISVAAIDANHQLPAWSNRGDTVKVAASGC